MLELGISQAQTQFTKLLTQTVVVVDKKMHRKKAVIMPYEEYSKLLTKSLTKKDLETGAFNQFIGLLDENKIIDDVKYNSILK